MKEPAMEQGGSSMSTKQDLIPFQFNDAELRVVKDNQGEPWFVTKDICNVLEIAQPARAVEGLDEDEKGVRKVHTLGGSQDMLTVNESGLYTLIIRSNKPQARAFRKWITSVVLPALRKTGSYSIPDADAMSNSIPDEFMKVVPEIVANEKHFRIPAPNLLPVYKRLEADPKAIGWLEAV